MLVVDGEGEDDSISMTEIYRAVGLARASPAPTYPQFSAKFFSDCGRACAA